MIPFQMFDASHLVTIILIALFSAVSIFLGKSVSDAKVDKAARFGLALLLLGNEVYINAAAVYAGEWRHTWALPLHLCDLSLFALLGALIWKNQLAWELSYFWGLGGSIPAVITPDIPMGFPHFYYVTFFIHHGGIIIGVLYLAFSGKFDIPLRSLKRVWLITHVYAGVIAIFNFYMGTNYLFLCSKPSQPTLLDFLGPWPFYLLGLEAIFIFALLLLFLLYKQIKKHSLR